ncbi:hypothetical protein PF008_g18489 [Phytophthora fragariae]|uniref:Uncharacterized protein n=1 Tax=Phytophthora fragariae TaxID=53985 RepID=A0A6G0R6B4_9STRA|nr:hypothetical protein PF008_g18489 [Phytophthora fragariae]
MGKNWHQVMFLWSKKLMQNVTRNASAFDKVTMPFLDNTLVPTATKTPETLRSGGLVTIKPLAQHGVFRPADLLELSDLHVQSASLTQAFKRMCAGYGSRQPCMGRLPDPD